MGGHTHLTSILRIQLASYSKFEFKFQIQTSTFPATTAILPLLLLVMKNGTPLCSRVESAYQHRHNPP